jgi:sterol desaturase/sphingolipid hydroxylase (fatty acid hydroxylase superfamily)
VTDHAILATLAPGAPRLAAFLGLAPALLAVLEAALRRWIWRRPCDWGELGASIGVGLGRRLVQAAGVGLVVPLPVLAHAHRLATIRMDSAAKWIALLLLVEFAYYWHHRASHRVRWFWATHAVHHSSSTLMLASAMRLGWTSRLGGALLFYAPLAWLGFPVQAVLGLAAAGLFYQFWIHADWLPRLGPLEWVLNTPSHHRVHHASNPEYLDCNYGGVLIVFDRLFGTFVVERADIAIRYGLVEPLASRNPLRIALHGWLGLARDLRAARGMRARLALVFGPP